MEYDPIKIVKLASDYIDDAWKYTFPWVNDVVEIWDTTNSVLVKTVKIKKYSSSDSDPDMVKMQYFSDSNEKIIESLDLYPSQIVAGQYTIDSICYCLKLVSRQS